jgi:hypothetical protein
MDSYTDPHFEPPVDIDGAEARAYEAKIVELLREASLPDSGRFPLESIELRGERPSTEIIFRYSDTADPKPPAVGFALWASEYPTSGAAEYGTLHEAASVAGWIYSAWTAGELEPIDIE